MHGTDDAETPHATISDAGSCRCRDLSYVTRGREELERQPVLQGVADQFRTGAEAELLEDTRAVRAHGLRGKTQLRGDLTHGSAGADQAQHFVLAVR